MSCPVHQLIANESVWVMKNIDIYKLFCGDQWEAKRSKVPNYIYISGKTVKKSSFFHSSHSNKRMYILAIK